MCECCCYIAYVLIAIFVVITLAVSFMSNVLRDDIDNPTEFLAKAALMPKFASKPIDEISRPFSLARTQFALWTVIIASTYILLVLCKKDCAIELGKSATALALLGISAGTAGLAKIIDQDQENGTKLRHQNAPSNGFFADILSDESGVSLHRLQNVIWTLVAITTYICHVSLDNCNLPELDKTILVLSGISSSAYLALKLRENK